VIQTDPAAGPRPLPAFWRVELLGNRPQYAFQRAHFRAISFASAGGWPRCARRRSRTPAGGNDDEAIPPQGGLPSSKSRPMDGRMEGGGAHYQAPTYPHLAHARAPRPPCSTAAAMRRARLWGSRCRWARCRFVLRRSSGRAATLVRGGGGGGRAWWRVGVRALHHAQAGTWNRGSCTAAAAPLRERPRCPDAASAPSDGTCMAWDPPPCRDLPRRRRERPPVRAKAPAPWRRPRAHGGRAAGGQDHGKG
jgi:hypothetical protein